MIVIGELRDLETDLARADGRRDRPPGAGDAAHRQRDPRRSTASIGVVPADQQAQVRTMLSESLRAVVSQRLLPRADGQGRVPALEIAGREHAPSANLIRENKTFQIHSILQTGAAQGMRLLDQLARASCVQAGRSTRETALRHCRRPEALRRLGGGEPRWRRLDQLLRQLKERRAARTCTSSAGLVPRVRRRGTLEAVAGEARPRRRLAARHAAPRSSSETQWQEFEASATSTSPTACPASRASAPTTCVQENGVGAVFRIVPRRSSRSRTSACRRRSARSRSSRSGLVLVTGPTGSGKSTTLAAIIDRINRDRREAHRHDRGSDRVRAPEQALGDLAARGRDAHRAASRRRCAPRCARTPDVILVGEMRDLRDDRARDHGRRDGHCWSSARCTPTAPPRPSTASSTPSPPRSRSRCALSLSESLARRRLAAPAARRADGKGRVRGARDPAAHAGPAERDPRGQHADARPRSSSPERAQGMQSMDDALFAAARKGRVAPEDA